MALVKATFVYTKVKEGSCKLQTGFIVSPIRCEGLVELACYKYCHSSIQVLDLMPYITSSQR
jgi:hypothetical protein